MTTALVTNDDGIGSPGLCALAEAARHAGLDVVVAAPAEEASGSSAAITGQSIAVTGRVSAGRIQVQRRELDRLPDVPAFAVHGAPGLIALIAAHGAFGPAPDLVLSGINRGANIGRAILHSGTVGAALTGGVNGARGLAVSLDVGLHPATLHWETAARVVAEVIPRLVAEPAGTVYNLNVPNVLASDPVEVCEASLAPFGIVQTTMTELDDENVRLAVRELPEEPEPGSDAALLLAGCAPLTSIVAVREARLAEQPARAAALRGSRP